MNRREASKYLLERHGIKRSPGTLAKYACVGGGPAFCKAGRQTIYEPALLDEYAVRLKSRPVYSTSELANGAAGDV